MRKILKLPWVVFGIWIIATVLFAFNQPNLNKILQEKGQATISNDSPSSISTKMLNKMGESKGESLIVVFNKSSKMSDSDMKSIEKGIKNLDSQKSQLKINNIIDPFSTPEIKKELTSKDGTTLMVQVTYEKGNRDPEVIINEFNSALKDVKVSHYLTGEMPINHDYSTATTEGVDKSAIITVGFILIVLMIVFRSFITPAISLFAVAISYLCSLGIIGILIDTVDFPITMLTQMFLILILFGIGTDYNILLFNRFKEELGKGLSIDEAIVTTYKTAGKTIIFSGLTVFVAFASLSFVQFPIYRSANAVAIGIAVLLLEILTFTPVIMKFLGKKLFWPSKNAAGHKDSRLWEKVTATSVKHPAISMILVAIIIAPVIFFNSTKLSFDTLKDLRPDTPSVKGFNIIAEKFGRGKAMPTTIVIENKEAMNNNEYLTVIDTLTEKLKKLDGVGQVSGVTQPTGEPIDNFYTNTQVNTVVNGLDSTNNGVEKINGGLEKINSSMKTPDFSSVQDLSNGTGSIENGMGEVTKGLVKINTGIEQGANGADKLTKGISELKSGVLSINKGLRSISSNLTRVESGYNQIGEGYKSLPGSIGQIKQLASAMQGQLTVIGAKLPGDKDVAQLSGLISQLSSSLDKVSGGLSSLNSNYSELTSGLNKLNDGLKVIIQNTSSESQLVKGINQLEAGEAALANGLRQGSAGQKTVISSMLQLKDGAGKVKAGQEALYTGLNTLSGGMTKLKDGIGKSSNGLKSVSNGIGKTNDFLNQLTNSRSFYIPKEAFKAKDFNKMLDAYMSKDRKVTKITVSLSSDPYSSEAIKVIGEMDNLVKNQLKGTKLSKASYGIAGPTATTNDLNNIANHDIVFTQIIVLVSIFILLVIVIRSFWIPVYIVGSLMAAYYTAISVTSFLTDKLFSGVGGMSWNVPFFSFIVIAALGVDYSIFIMERYKEYTDLKPTEAIVLASKNIGGVVMSAVVILCGTFATLYPSNIHLLMELAICIITGLVVLSFVLLPIAIPALISINHRLTTREEKTKAASNSRQILQN
ncbi:MMPL family transporter [Clostridium cylindrosporum]|uniref:Putative membrane protein YdgH n=1 Tax=Clostridium cylindrosporum DSM 605 TaxID=1121307 RepID=A0A0J8G2H5_CLOCY|nr:MMPL family transporter [Clostridium cylindrosporum]KMT21931.1 putative membrane protein YdgH [Clostridium cylindrosporum DSM 605]